MTREMPAELVELVPMVHRQARAAALRCPAYVDVDDLLQAGMRVLLEAHRRFRPGTGHTLESWAVGRVKCAILDEQRNADHLARGARELVREISRATELVQQRLCRRPRDSEVAAALSMSLLQYHRALASAWRGSKLSTEESLEEALAVPAEHQYQDGADILSDLQVAETLTKALAGLQPRMRDVVTRVCAGEQMSTIGTDWGIAGSRVSQVHQEAVERLRGVMKHATVPARRAQAPRHFALVELVSPDLESGCAGFDLLA